MGAPFLEGQTHAARPPRRHHPNGLPPSIRTCPRSPSGPSAGTRTRAGEGADGPRGTYLVEGFGKGRLIGTASWLGYIAAVVIVCSMVAVSFGSYATSLFVGDHAGPARNNIFTSALIVLMVAVNLVGAKFVAKAQSLIVAGVLGVFAVFICVTVPNISTDLLAPSDHPSLSKIIASVALTFFAYLGFNVITFAAGDMREPNHDLPRAMYLALGITAVVYVLIALGVFGALTVQEVIGYGETAIAEAARPTLGDAGFTVMAVAALLSTAGATNATLYASGNLTGMLAEERLFPPFFGAHSRLGQHAGLLVTAGLVLCVANLVDLSAIASVGSAVALMVFLLVGAAGWRRRKDTGSRPVAIIALAFVSVVLDALVRHGPPSHGLAAPTGNASGDVVVSVMT